MKKIGKYLLVLLGLVVSISARSQNPFQQQIERYPQEKLHVTTDKDDYTALNTLAPAKLRVRTQLRTQGSRKTIRAEIRNVGHSVAFAIHLQPYRLSDAERILPFTADDNYFTLFQGESRVIEIEFDGSLLPDDRYELRAEAYNSPRP